MFPEKHNSISSLEGLVDTLLRTRQTWVQIPSSAWLLTLPGFRVPNRNMGVTHHHTTGMPPWSRAKAYQDLPEDQVQRRKGPNRCLYFIIMR